MTKHREFPTPPTINRSACVPAGYDPVGRFSERDAEVVARALPFAAGPAIPEHAHVRGQIAFTSDAVLRVKTCEQLWVVPESRAIWVPDGVSHQTWSLAPRTLHSLYIKRGVGPNLPKRVALVRTTPLLRELVRHLALEEIRPAAYARALEVTYDQLRLDEGSPVVLQTPKHPKLKVVFDALLRDPSDDRTLEDWVQALHVSSRTLLRTVKAETGLDFRAWRRQVVLTGSLEPLLSGAPVKSVALDCGYTSASAFIAAFKAVFGLTPGQYVKGLAS